MAIQTLDASIVTALAASGSDIATKRETIPFEAIAKDSGSGFIFTPSTSPAYDPSALKKAINTDLGEMSVPEEEQVLDLVPRPLYEDALEALATAEQIIETQSVTIADLEIKVSELQSQIETLSSDLDNERLQRVVAEANADNFRQQLQLINESAQVALQRSILEGIERTSCEAISEGLRAEVAALKEKTITLQQQIDSLNNLIAGRDAQIQAGAEFNGEITVRVVSKPETGDSDLSFITSVNRASWNSGTWINGPVIEIGNYSTVDQTINIDMTENKAKGGLPWLLPPTTNGVAVNNIVIKSQERIFVKFAPDYASIRNIMPTKIPNASVFGVPILSNQTATTSAGKITINSNTTSFSLSTKFRKTVYV